MIFSTATELSKRGEADLIALPFWEGVKEKAKPASPLTKEFEEAIKLPLATKDFQGKEGEILLLYPSVKEKRVILLGLGKEEKLTQEILRKSWGAVAKIAIKKKLTTLNVVLPNIAALRSMDLEGCLRGVCEGILSVNYLWQEKENSSENASLQKVHLIGVNPKVVPLLKQISDVAEGVYFARDLINGNADIITPQYLAKAASGLSAKFSSIKTQVFDRKRIEKEKMGLLLAVGKGATHDPAFIMMEYRGNPKSKDHTVLVGKGITFDTGGLNLKPTGSMETMRADMSGAAAVLGTIAAIAALGLKINVTGVIPTCENAIDANSFKPGDIYRSYLGKTVEIGNTDAEGRLILADALSYAVKNLKPTRMINLATLTGAVVIALGEEMAGVLSNDEKLANALIASGEATGEHLWQFPLYPSYKEHLKSDIADLKNIGHGRSAGVIMGGLFLAEFVGDVPWAHLDIAGVAFASKERNYIPKNGTGFGIRLLVNYLSTL